MEEIIKAVIVNILTALYQPFGFAVIISVLYLFTWKQYRSTKQAIIQWIHWFKNELLFRKMFGLTFYTVMILCKTLLNRAMWANPLSSIIGVWGLHKFNSAGEIILTTEVPENLALFIPLTILLLWTYRDKILNNDKKDNPRISLLRVL